MVYSSGRVCTSGDIVAIDGESSAEMQWFAVAIDTGVACLVDVEVVVECLEVGTLLDRKAWLCSHDEAVEAHDAVRGVEGSHALAFFANGYSPEGVHAVHLKVVFPPI